jgi:sec-independent protein translocase protein TatC
MDNPVSPPQDQARPLLDHFQELRGRLLGCLGAVAAASLGGWFLSDGVIARMAGWVGGELVFLSPAEALMAKIKIALALGVFLAAPVIIFHVWRFVGVALTVSERRVVLGALPFSYLLFACGAALAWWVLIHAGLRFLISFQSGHLRPLISVAECLYFTLWTSLGMGILFQVPVVLTALAKWGLVRSATLRRYRRHAVVVILLAGGLLTPGPDVSSQLILALPTYLLFELSLVLMRWFEPKVY